MWKPKENRRTGHWKPFFAGVLAAALALGPCAGLSAANAASTVDTTGGITVDGAVAGRTFSAYRVFDVTRVAEEDGSVSYQNYAYPENQTWMTSVLGTNAVAAAQRIRDETVLERQNTAQALAAALASASPALVPDKTVTASDAATEVALSPMPIGYYLVVCAGAGGSEALSILSYAGENTTVRLKSNVIPSFSKQGRRIEDDSATWQSTELYADKNETLEFKLQSSITSDYFLYNNYQMKFVDTPSRIRIRADENLRVTVGDNTYAYNPQTGTFPVPWITMAQSGQGALTVTVWLRQNGEPSLETVTADTPVLVRYWADTPAVDQLDHLLGWNLGQLYYTVSSMGTLVDEPLEQGMKVHSAIVQLTKRNMSGTTISDGIAKFALYGPRRKEIVSPEADSTFIRNGTTYYLYGVFATQNGVAEMRNLGTGVYYIVEVKAPAGYALATGPIEMRLQEKNGGVFSVFVTFDGRQAATETDTDGLIKLNIQDKTSIVLPASGAAGLPAGQALLGLGLLVAGAAGVLYLCHRRRHS